MLPDPPNSATGKWPPSHCSTVDRGSEMLRKLLDPGVPRLAPGVRPQRARVLVPLTAVLALLLAAVPALATARTTAQTAGGFTTSFETGQPAPTWTSTPEVDAKGQKLASGVTRSSILDRGPSSPGGDNLLG